MGKIKRSLLYYYKFNCDLLNCTLHLTNTLILSQVQHEQVEEQLVQEGVQPTEPVEVQPLQEEPLVQEMSTVEIKPMTHVQVCYRLN